MIQTPVRKPSPAERAMAANASSRDRQGKRQDSVTRNLHIGMMGDGTEEQNLCQIGDPSARITFDEVEAAFGGYAPGDRHAHRTAENEGMAGHRDRRGLADDMPDR